MSVKIINIAIPDDEEVPDIIHTFSPKENFMMLKIGSICLNEGRNYVANLSQEEIYKKIIKITIRGCYMHKSKYE